MTEQSKGQGFASFSKEKRREISSMGGKAAWQSGKAHKFTSEEARIAGKKGGRPRKVIVSRETFNDNLTIE
jgi:general stress protein YciG